MAIIPRAERVPPHSMEAEMALLGAALISEPAADALGETVQRAEFYSEPHRRLYDAMTWLRAAEAPLPVDVFTVPEELRRRGCLEACGGIKYLHDLIDACTTAASFEYYAAVVREKALYRGLVGAGSDLESGAYQQEEPAAAVLMAAEATLYRLGAGRVPGGFRTADQVATAFFERIEAGPQSGMSSGLPALDRLLGGWRTTNLYLVGGRPGQGKTAAGLCFLLAAAQAGIPAAFFSLEMAEAELWGRLCSIESGLPVDRVLRGDLRPHEQAELIAVNGALGNLPILLDEGREATLPALRSRARAARRKHGAALFVVDYLQLVQPEGKAEMDVRHFTAVAEGLKSMARELQVPVIALSQLSRKCEERKPPRPITADLRESGGLEQAADVILLLFNPNQYLRQAGEPVTGPDPVDLIVAKHRNGATGCVKALFMGEQARFVPMDARYSGEEPPPAVSRDWRTE